MRVPERWLREWVDPKVDSDDLCERLTLLGLEVEAVETAAPAFSGVVIGEIVAVEGHPRAERLQVCRVTDGTAEHTVVCGAANARAGLRAPLALEGAQLPGGGRIRRAEVRGVESAGMLCSARELGMGQEGDGLLELPATAPVGTDLRAFARLDEPVIELELTPNRGDCLSIRGLAREVATAWRLEARGPALDPVPAVRDDALPVWLEAPSACPRYVGRVIRDADTAATPPLWLTERLQRAGVRPVSAVVDVTNYVMLELGQPLHAFDLRRLSASITVRWAQAGESLALLDGRTVELDGETLVIADANGPVALAGIMGGAASAVDTGTRDLFLESACFQPGALAGRARRYASHTDSSHRFERGVDPALQQLAVERATRLIVDICGGEPGPAHDTVESDALPRRPAIELRRARLERLLGDRPGGAEIEGILGRLGLRLRTTEAGWQATPPSWRYDLALEADLIEEVARVRGYNRAPRTHGSRPARITPRPEAQRGADRIRDTLVERDYREIVTYSFVDATLQQRFEPDAEPLALANPIASDMGVMRAGLWPGLVQTLQRNANRQQARVRLFELGRVFAPGSGAEHDALGLLASGPAWPEQWDARPREADFFDLKGDLEAVLGTGHFEFAAATHPALHPGQSARLLAAGEPAGWIGVLHPRLQRTLALERAPVLGEIRLAPLLNGRLPAFRALSRYPSIRRDLALLVAEAIPARDLLDTVRDAAGADLQDAFIFDVYRGRGVDSGRKSVALGLILQGLSRTLTDSEVEAAVEAILEQLRQRHGATLRE